MNDPMGTTKESLRSSLKRASRNVADATERTSAAGPVLAVIAASLAILAAAAAIGVMVYVARR